LIPRGEVSDIAVLAKECHEDFGPRLSLILGSWEIVEEVGSLGLESLPKLFESDLATSYLLRFP
jgi:hypothetical protein